MTHTARRPSRPPVTGRIARLTLASFVTPLALGSLLALPHAAHAAPGAAAAAHGHAHPGAAGATGAAGAAGAAGTAAGVATGAETASQGTPHPMVHRFKDPERWAKDFDAPDRDAWQRPQLVIAALELKPGMTAVDLGAGTGYFEPHLHAAVSPGGKVVALDIEQPMVDYIKARAAREKLTTVTAQRADVDDPRLPPASTDRVLVVDVWHHIPQRVPYAKKLAAALRPGGAVVVVDFKLDAKKGPPRHHRLAPAAIAADLREAGLQTEEKKVDLPEQYIVIGRKPAENR